MVDIHLCAQNTPSNRRMKKMSSIKIDYDDEARTVRSTKEREGETRKEGRDTQLTGCEI